MSTAAISPSFTRFRERSVRPARTASVRLTHRGQVVAVLLVLGVLLGVLTAFGSYSAATGEAGTPVPTRTVEVGSGDTLWEIASESAAPGHVREMVLRIQELNALPDSSLRVGQQIAVPVS